MRKIVMSFLVLAICSISFVAQAQGVQGKDMDIKEASITLVPEKQWCIKCGYVLDNGAPDYTRALQDKSALDLVNSIEGAMANRGYEAENLSAKLDFQMNQDAMAMVNGHAQLDVEAIVNSLSIATFEISYAVDFTYSGMYEIRLKAIDTATQKVLFAKTYTTSNISDFEGNQQNKAVIDNLFNRIDARYASMLQYGRESMFILVIKDGCKLNFFDNVQYMGDTGKFNELIDFWMSENAISTNYRIDKSSENLMLFRDVRMPLKKTRKAWGGKTKVVGIEAEQFLNGMIDILHTQNLEATIYPIGINGAFVIIDNRF